MPYSSTIEVPTPIAPNVYDGTMQAETFEIAEPGLPVTTNLIRTTQDWGIKVKWEMHGPLAVFLDADFHIRGFLESIGPGTEYAQPVTDIVVNTLSVPLTVTPDGPTREYEVDINIPKGTVEPHPYKLVAFIQLYSCCPKSHKYPIAGMCELPVVDIFEPE